MSYTPAINVDSIVKKVWEYTTRTLTEFPPARCLNVVDLSYYATVAANSSMTIDINDPGTWWFTVLFDYGIEVDLEESDDGVTYTKVHRKQIITYVEVYVTVVEFKSPYNRIVLTEVRGYDERVSVWGCKLK